ncbi:DNA topoisomerase IB [Leucobacter allii]|uniref:DNA topoisomerase IB n=1 Tax=Leucobacter allii TaxID=2932247 RepID=UPI001FD38086|nr:DNA topoisomerase IB [Leucobacter allii]UOR00656.1 DNA topoisomerase IB [Leucobacter allii]
MNAEAPRSRGRRLAITRRIEDGEAVYLRGGRRITRRSELSRLDALAVPPAWTDVEISASPRSKILARGVDAAGRAQAIYHPAFRARQDREKFARMVRFARALPALRARVDRDLRRRRLGRDRVSACVIRLIDRELFRVGNPEYARRHRSFGVTTLREDHVVADTTAVEFDFVGKSGARQSRRVADPRIARVVARLQELPGPELFRFFDEDGEIRELRSRHVNAYLRRHAGRGFSAKDFRTWGATVIVAAALTRLDPADAEEPKLAAAAARDAVREAAERLGNTPAVTRSAYVDPRVLAAFEDAGTVAALARARRRMRARRHLTVDEQCALALLTGSIGGGKRGSGGTGS